MLNIFDNPFVLSQKSNLHSPQLLQCEIFFSHWFFAVKNERRHWFDEPLQTERTEVAYV